MDLDSTTNLAEPFDYSAERSGGQFHGASVDLFQLASLNYTRSAQRNIRLSVTNDTGMPGEIDLEEDPIVRVGFGWATLKRKQTRTSDFVALTGARVPSTNGSVS